MPRIKIQDVTRYVEKNIGRFHAQRIGSIKALRLTDILKRKNPYLFRAKNILTAADLIRNLVDAHISSNEETIFGDWLEELAVFINQKAFGGMKSGIPGIDLEFERDGVRYIVTIKSGPNWGNSRQISKMVSDFNSARKVLRTSRSRINVVAVNGCCYGRDKNPEKKDNYLKLCGQNFWEFISGDKDLYVNIIEPLAHKAKEKNDEFMTSYGSVLNAFTRDFMTEFCLTDGRIDWKKIVQYNSSAE